ncbi:MULTISPECIES: phage protease [unclassified Ensifer]|uniref:phage protease n=1 Tax=unclassified Ensifer TaxID=2633371 RepID=UPI000812C1EE|nr:MULTISPECIES: phage protease [unclassified Ensifer]OCP17444.1 hypothetical protein BC361_08275 [Ensifer sp. LC54]OCP28650.1 hypothetical protein BC363_02080 [Ensifer sp. LC384]
MNTNRATHFEFTCFSADLPPEVLAMTSVTAIDVFATGAATADKPAPEWIKLTPRGAFTSRDGRSFDTSPEVLAERFSADGVAVPIDLDHATVKKALFGDAAPAVGWIEELQARVDGLYGRVAWLEEGLRVLAARTHRYISPALKADDAGKATWLHSAALVAAPGISMPAVASATPTSTEKNMLKEIAAALGLAAEASEASCLSAITDLRKRIDPAVHQETLNTLAARDTELATIKKTGRDKEVNDLIEGALTAKKIAPAQKDAYVALCATDDGFAQVKTLLSTLGAGLGTSGLDNKQPADQLATLSAEDREVMKMMGVTEEEFRKANGLATA